MGGNGYQIRDLNWDSRLFGQKMGEVVLAPELESETGFEEPTWLTTLDHASQSGYRFLLCQIDAKLHRICHSIFKSGATLGDILVTLKLRLNEPIKSTNIADKYAILTATAADLADILAMAEDSFEYSRFYQDPNFNRAKANLLYQSWIKESFKTKETYLVLWDNGIRKAFISTQALPEGKTLVIKLLAVVSQYRGQGLGQVLLNWLIKDAYHRGFENLQVGTQAGNTTAIRLYERNGFLVERVIYRLHIWLNNSHD